MALCTLFQRCGCRDAWADLDWRTWMVFRGLQPRSRRPLARVFHPVHCVPAIVCRRHRRDRNVPIALWGKLATADASHSDQSLAFFLVDHARIVAATTASVAVVPSASPFSKSPSD